MTAERVLLTTAVALTLAVFILTGFDYHGLAIFSAFWAGSGLWWLAVNRVPYPFLYRAYVLGSLIPCGLAVIALLVVR